MFAFTIAALWFLLKARQPVWRGVFCLSYRHGPVGSRHATGSLSPGVTSGYVSHFYFGMVAAMLMIFSLAILPEIYKSKRWRLTHVVLNSVALLLFVSQGITGGCENFVGNSSALAGAVYLSVRFLPIKTCE